MRSYLTEKESVSFKDIRKVNIYPTLMTKMLLQQEVKDRIVQKSIIFLFLESFCPKGQNVPKKKVCITSNARKNLNMHWIQIKGL